MVQYRDCCFKSCCMVLAGEVKLNFQTAPIAPCPGGGVNTVVQHTSQGDVQPLERIVQH